MVNEDKIKKIFDNLRNISLAALLLVVSVKVWQLSPDHRVVFYYFKGIAILLGLASLSLFLLNVKHAVLVYFPGSEESWNLKQRLLYGAVLCVYLLCAFPVFAYMVIR